MDQVVERKHDVLKRLNKEIDSLATLQELTNRSSTVSGGMVTILDSFEHRLAKLETTILPVYQQTGNLQRRHQNIEKTLTALEHVLSFHNAAGETEGIIRGGRPGEGAGGVEGYLTALDQLAAARNYFTTQNSQSIELSNVVTLHDAGTEALGREFRDELKKYQRPLNPIVLLDLVALDAEELNEEVMSGIELIPASAREDLSLVAAWLDEHSEYDKLTVYAKIRSQTMMQSMQCLADHQRTHSAERGGVRGLGATPARGLAPLTPGGTSSPAPALRSRLANKMDNTPKRGHRITNMLERKTNWMLQRAKGGRQGGLLTASPGAATSPFSPYTPTSPFNVSGLSPSPGNTSVVDEQLEDGDVLLYITQITAVARLGVVEQRLVSHVVPQARQVATLDTLLKEPLDHLAQQGEHVSTCGLRSMQRGDTTAMLCLLTLLRHLHQTLPEYQTLLRHCQAALLAKYTATTATMQNTVIQCLEVVMEGVRGDGGDRALPRDGTVHQQTSNSLIFVQQLQEYTSALGDILYKDVSLRSMASVKLLTGDSLTFEQCQALLAAYIKRVLSNLALSIVQRSEAYSDVHLRAVFRLNNYNYLLTTLLTTGLIATLELVEPNARQQYNDLILTQKQLYSQSWSAVLHFLSGHDEPPASQLQPGRLRDRDRQVMKDRFSGFNKELEEMQRTQRSYSLPDRKLRDSIKRDNKEYILPKYQDFYDRYSSVPFSRNTDKYVKYSPAEVAGVMDKFFDVAA